MADFEPESPEVAEAPAEEPPKKPFKQDLFGGTTTVGTKTINASPIVLTVGVYVGWVAIVELIKIVKPTEVIPTLLN